MGMKSRPHSRVDLEQEILSLKRNLQVSETRYSDVIKTNGKAVDTVTALLRRVSWLETVLANLGQDTQPNKSLREKAQALIRLYREGKVLDETV